MTAKLTVGQSLRSSISFCCSSDQHCKNSWRNFDKANDVCDGYGEVVVFASAALENECGIAGMHEHIVLQLSFMKQLSFHVVFGHLSQLFLFQIELLQLNPYMSADLQASCL